MRGRTPERRKRGRRTQLLLASELRQTHSYLRRDWCTGRWSLVAGCAASLGRADHKLHGGRVEGVARREVLRTCRQQRHHVHLRTQRDSRARPMGSGVSYDRTLRADPIMHENVPGLFAVNVELKVEKVARLLQVAEAMGMVR